MFVCNWERGSVFNKSKSISHDLKNSFSNRRLNDSDSKENAQNNYDELRVYLFNTSADKSHWNLPPTSVGLLPHIKRAFYNTYNMTNVLMANLK